MMSSRIAFVMSCVLALGLSATPSWADAQSDCVQGYAPVMQQYAKFWCREYTVVCPMKSVAERTACCNKAQHAGTNTLKFWKQICTDYPDKNPELCKGFSSTLFEQSMQHDRERYALCLSAPSP